MIYSADRNCGSNTDAIGSGQLSSNEHQERPPHRSKYLHLSKYLITKFLYFIHKCQCHVCFYSGDNKIENVELLNPVNLSLECIWTGNQNKHPNITGYWRKGGVEIQDSRVPVDPENQQYTLKRV